MAGLTGLLLVSLVGRAAATEATLGPVWNAFGVHGPAGGSQLVRPAGEGAGAIAGTPDSADNGSAAPAGEPPTGLMEVFQEARHRILEEGGAPGAYLASNYSQELHARFEAEGVVVTPRREEMGEWSLRLRTVAWGRAGAMRSLPVGERASLGRRLEYRHEGLTEWYVNEPSKGIEHGFTVVSRPAGEGPLRLELATSGLEVELRDARTALLLKPGGDVVLRYEGLAVLDARGAALPARLVAPPQGLVVEVDDDGAAYPLTVDPLIVSQQAKLSHGTGEGVEGGSQSGYSVALELDTALVGAPGDTTAATESPGAVYVFTRSGATWTQQAVLLASDGATSDFFGYSVAVSGDTALVGAARDDNAGGANAGAAYVFIRSGSTWTQQQKLLASDGAIQAYFGSSVAVSSDTALVGRPGGSEAESFAGAAYVFTRSDGIWTEQQKLLADDGQDSDSFGTSVALSGETALVGAEYGDGAGGDEGAAYVFTRSGSIWTQQQKLLADDGEVDDSFGYSVALSGDTALVGAYYAAADPGIYAGAAYVFTRSGTWTQEAKLVAVDGQYPDRFGYSVALSGDTALVGAYLDDNAGGYDAGAAYVFTRSDTGWTQQQMLVAGTGADSHDFGHSVALSGDTALVGAFGDDDAGADAGAAYVFTRSAGTWAEQQKLVASDSSDVFGLSVGVSGDTALVGAPLDDDAGRSDAGAAYVFTRSGSTWTEQAKLLASDGAAGDGFGISVAVSGDTALVGAYSDDHAGATNAGAAYVFTRSGTTWTEQQKLLAGDGATGDQFGYSVALSGHTALAGAYRHDTAGSLNAGAAYVFTRSGINWTQQQKLLASQGAADDWFGYSVALSGDTALVGAWMDDNAGGNNAGAAYVFTRSGTSWSEQELLASDGGENDKFGASVALAGDTALVGAHGDDNAGGTDAGAAYVFTSSGSTWNEQQKLLASDGAAGDFFGISVALSGATALVGAEGDDDAATDTGAAYVFTRSGTIWSEQEKLLASDGAAFDFFGISVALSGATALVGAYGADTPAGSDAGAAYAFVLISEGSFYTLTPCRVLDTRQGAGAPLAGGVHLFPLRGACGIPATARAVALNVTATQGTGSGHLTLYPADQALPGTSTINFAASQTRANNAVVPLATGTGELAVAVAVAGGGTAHVILDVTGYFE